MMSSASTLAFCSFLSAALASRSIVCDSLRLNIALSLASVSCVPFCSSAVSMSSSAFSCSLRFSESESSSLSCTVCSWPRRSCNLSTSRSCETVSSSTSALRPASSSESTSRSARSSSAAACLDCAAARDSSRDRCSSCASPTSVCPCSAASFCTASFSAVTRSSSLRASCSWAERDSPTSICSLVSVSSAVRRPTSSLSWTADPLVSSCTLSSAASCAFFSSSASSACFFIFSSPAFASASLPAVPEKDRCSPRADIIVRCISLSASSSWPSTAFLRVTASSHRSRISADAARVRSSMSLRPSISLS
mmetsp:Transcript_28404/g.57274  ORF Transcript_28404/g.57274 Transcript_28404/m.57274 type:complete len:308 (-) Transcript_28404:639-1562(-)